MLDFENVTQEGDKTSVYITGRINNSTADEFVDKLGGLISEETLRLNINMSRVNYISSNGIRALLHFYRKMSKKGAVLTIEEPSDVVMDILTITGLKDYLIIE